MSRVFNLATSIKSHELADRATILTQDIAVIQYIQETLPC